MRHSREEDHLVKVRTGWAVRLGRNDRRRGTRHSHRGSHRRRDAGNHDRPPRTRRAGAHALFSRHRGDPRRFRRAHDVHGYARVACPGHSRDPRDHCAAAVGGSLRRRLNHSELVIVTA